MSRSQPNFTGPCILYAYYILYIEFSSLPIYFPLDQNRVNRLILIIYFGQSMHKINRN